MTACRWHNACSANAKEDSGPALKISGKLGRMISHDSDSLPKIQTAFMIR